MLLNLHSRSNRTTTTDALGRITQVNENPTGVVFSGSKLDWGRIAHAAEGGAVAGGIAGLAGPEAGIAAKVVISAGGSVIGGATERELNGEAVINPTAMAINALGGAAGAAAGACQAL